MVDDHKDAAKADRADAAEPAAMIAADERVSARGEIPACCVATIQQHVRHNPMMVCTECKHIIKCFTDERAFQNYLVFCRSRRRPVLTGVVDGYHTVAFRSYDTAYGR